MMKKMSVAEAAEFFGVSKEAIHNRIRRGSLQSVVENGQKMVLFDETTPKMAKKRVIQHATGTQSERYYKLLEEQNAKLQQRVEILEQETRTLRDQKEQMLIQERQKLEQIYKEKDEQLKNILATISSKFMLQAAPSVQEPQVLEEETFEAEITPSEEVSEEPSEVISLKKYLKKQNFSEKKSAKIFKRFKKVAKKDDRIIILGNKYYIDTAKYSYDDIIF